MMSKRIYLAGPEVFLSNAREIGACKRAICEQHGILGVFPTDEEGACYPASSRPDQGIAISRAMECRATAKLSRSSTRRLAGLVGRRAGVAQLWGD